MSLQVAANYWKAKLLAGAPINRVRVRRLLELQGAERRGSAIMANIRAILEAHDLQTVPDFQSVWPDTLVTVRLREGFSVESPLSSGTENGTAEDCAELATPEMTDPGLEPGVTEETDAVPRGETLNSSEGGQGIVTSVNEVDPVARVSNIATSLLGVSSVLLDDKLTVATTRMALKGYSQLAIMQGDREVRGMVSWESIAQRSMTTPLPILVKDCKVDAQVVDSDTSLSDVAPVISNYGYVLVRARDKKITGIVTATDLAEEFGKNAYAFLRIRTIEIMVRGKLHPLLTQADFAQLEEDSRARREADPAFLTFGENIRLLERTDVWQRLGVAIDKTEFVKRMGEIREIRNEVMHFDPQPLSSDKRIMLDEMENFLRRLFVSR